MIPNGLFSQIIVTALSIGIVVTYVMPTFDKIAAQQNEINKYKEEHEKISAVNSKLSQLSASINAVSTENQRRLLTYMPDSIDTIDVPRTLEAIARTAGVTINDIAHEESSNQNASVGTSYESTGAPQPKTDVFSLDVTCSYAQLKQLLSLLEQNEFPLEVTGLEVSKSEDGELSVQLSLTTYSHTYSAPAPAGDGTGNEAITL